MAKRWKEHPTYRQAFDALTDLQKTCPFALEYSRGAEELWPCPDRYVSTCGCHDGSLTPRARWKRPA